VRLIVVAFVLLLGELTEVILGIGLTAGFASIVKPFTKKTMLFGLGSFNGGRLVVGVGVFELVRSFDIINPNGCETPFCAAPLRVI
jgi:hypothetical protein